MQGFKPCPNRCAELTAVSSLNLTDVTRSKYGVAWPVATWLRLTMGVSTLLSQGLHGEIGRKKSESVSDNSQPMSETYESSKVGSGIGETSEDAAARMVFVDGRVFASEAEAKRHKESFLAHQRQLDYDRDRGSVVSVDDVVAAVAAEYALVRNRLLNIATRVAPRARCCGRLKKSGRLSTPKSHWF